MTQSSLGATGASATAESLAPNPGTDQQHGWVDAFVRGESRRRRRGRAELWVERGLGIVLVLAIWQALSSLGVKQILISDPHLVGKDLGSWVAQSAFWSDLRVTLVEMLIGLAIGTAAGVVAGVGVGLRPRLSKAVQPLTVAVHTVPIVVLAPLFLLWFGFGQTPKLLIVTLSVFFVMFFNALAGTAEVDPAQILSLRIMGCGRIDVLRQVYLPSVVSWVIVAFRSAISYALVGAVVSEFLAANAGLGYELQNASQLLDVPRVFSVLIVLGVLGGLMSGIVDLVERWALRWR